jgi:hypothetical protein
MTLFDDMQKMRKDVDRLQDMLLADIKSIDERLTSIERSFGEWTAVTNAMSQKSVTTRQFVMGVFALMIPLVVLGITILATHP